MIRFFQVFFISILLVSVSFSTMAQNENEPTISEVDITDETEWEVIKVDSLNNTKYPEFIGGQDSMIRFISLHVVYPQQAIDKNKTGSAWVGFTVDTMGSIHDVEIVGDPMGFGLDEAAIEVVKKMDGMWIPGKLFGKKVKMKFKVPIRFLL